MADGGDTWVSGSSAVATLDSVAATTKLIGYKLLRFDKYVDYKENHFVREPYKTVGQNQSDFLLNKDSWEKSRGQLLKGKGLGRYVIEKFIGKNVISHDKLVQAVATLKDTGELTTIIDSIQYRIDLELDLNLWPA